jgi:uncharacterized membrane protein YeaQ/YmgE (transglycosylase-associated protein family)
MTVSDRDMNIPKAVRDRPYRTTGSVLYGFVTLVVLAAVGASVPTIVFGVIGNTLLAFAFMTLLVGTVGVVVSVLDTST